MHTTLPQTVISTQCLSPSEQEDVKRKCRAKWKRSAWSCGLSVWMLREALRDVTSDDAEEIQALS